MKKLTIVTICYNEPRVEETCKSVVEQTWQDFEWVVIDGGSNEKTLKVFEKYKTRIDKFISESDNGIYNAYNKGLSLASGKYISFMNAGDSFYHREILKIFNCLTESNCADVYYGNCELALNNVNETVISNYPKTITSNFFITHNICTQGMFIMKALFDIFGGFNEKYKICADYLKWLQFKKNNVTFEYLPLIVARYDLNGVSSKKETRKITNKEKSEIKDMFFSKNEISSEEMKIEMKNKSKLSFWEKIFSVKNSFSGTHKVVTILSCSLRWKRRFY